MKNKSSSHFKTMRKAETEEQTLDRKAEAKNKALRQYVNHSGDSFEVSVKELIMVRANKAAYSINAIKYEARIRAEQDADRLLKNMKLKILGQKYDEVAITQRSTSQALQSKREPNRMQRWYFGTKVLQRDRTHQNLPNTLTKAVGHRNVETFTRRVWTPSRNYSSNHKLSWKILLS